MAEAGLDLMVTYSSESELASSRYLADFWPFFDFAGVVVPREGEAALVTGGPESYEMAKEYSRIKNILINPLFVESGAPEWVPSVDNKDFGAILKAVCQRPPKRIGLTDGNIFPARILDDLKRGAPDAEFVAADDVLLKVRAIKSEYEMAVIRKAYYITEQALIDVVDDLREGQTEWEIEAKARATMRSMGAEGTSYPIWVCSGPHTHQSLSKSSNRRIKRDELVQLTFGARYMGYCGNLCRPLVIGQVPDKARQLMSVALEAVDGALHDIRPGVPAQTVFKKYYDTLSKYGFEDFTLYGPAHGTGVSECEGLWLGREADFVIQPGMQFNVDVWLSDGEYGVRYEDGIIVNQTGIEELTSYRREEIIL